MIGLSPIIWMPKTVTYNITFLLIYNNILKNTRNIAYGADLEFYWLEKDWLACAFFFSKFVGIQKQTYRKKVNMKLKYSSVKVLLFGKYLWLKIFI